MTEKINQRNSQFDPDKSDLSSLSADELVRAITGIEAPTLKQKFEALEFLADKDPKGGATLNLMTDIICQLQKPHDHSNDSKDVAKGKDEARRGALAPLEVLVNNPDGCAPEYVKHVIKLAKNFYLLEDHFSVLGSQIDAAKSNPF